MLTNDQRERNERRRQALFDSYSIEHQYATGQLTAQEAEAAKRKLMSFVTNDVVSDGATYAALREGEKVILAGDTDTDLEQLAHALGGYSEVHQLLRRPLGLDELVDASQGWEGVSSLARDREQGAAYRKVMHNRDQEALQLRQLTQDQYDARAQARFDDEARSRGETLSDDWSAEDTEAYIERRTLEDEQRAAAEQEWLYSHGKVRKGL